MWIRDSNGNPSVKRHDFNRYDHTRITTEAAVRDSDPGRLTAGSGMRIFSAGIKDTFSRLTHMIKKNGAP